MMKSIARIAPALLGGLSALVVVVGLLGAMPAASAAAAITATPSPTATSEPVFTATLDVIPDRQHIRVGETLVVTLGLTVAAGCEYPVFETRLTQSGPFVPLFSYVEPPTHTVFGPPISLPFSYTLQAVAPGYVVLDGRLYGEQYCGDFWHFTYITGTSPSLKVEAWPYKAHLPVVQDPAAIRTVSRCGLKR